MSELPEPVPPRGRGEAPPPWTGLLPAAWRRPGGMPPPDEVWTFLQEWVRSARTTMDELEGYLLASADEAALAALAPAARLADLERVRAGLAVLERAGDLDAFEAALRSLPGLVSAYGRLVPWRALFQSHDRPRLVMAHRYLTDGDLTLPPDEAYAELRELRGTLLDMLADPETVLSPGGRRRFWDGFAAFQFRYADVYIREHDRRRRPEALAPYRALRDRPAFRLLRRLQALEGAPVRAGLAELEGRLQRLLATQCPGVDEKVIEARPVCTCGFRLDDPAPEPVEALEQAARQEAWHGLRMLFDPEVRRRLHAFVAEGGSGSEGDGPGARLKAVLAWAAEYPKMQEGPPASPDGAGAGELEHIERLLDDETIAYMNQGLRRSGRVVVRPLEALVDELQDRELSWDQLRNLVEQWAFGEYPHERGLLVRPLWGDGREGTRRAKAGAARTRPDGEADAELRALATREPGRRKATTAGTSAEGGRFPQTFAEWEKLYAGDEGAEDGRRQEAFRRFYRRHVKGAASGSGTSLPLNLFETPVEAGLLQGVQRPVTLPVLLERAGTGAGSAGRVRRLAWVDALRWDVGRRFLDKYRSSLEVLDTGFLWALPPATTAGQMAKVDARGIRFSLWEVAASAGDAGRFTPGGPGVGATGALTIAYLRGIEQALDGPEEASPDALADVLAGELLPLLEAGEGGEWLVFGDHGFTGGDGEEAEGGEGRKGHGPRRFRQGGDTMEEVIVPWMLLRWAGPPGKE